MMKLKHKFSLLFLLINLCAVAQMSSYQYQREIRNAKKGWHKIVVPDDIFAKTKPYLDDVRVYGITSTDTVEAPYMLHLSEGKQVEKQISFKVINQSHLENGFYYTFQLDKTENINQILLSFGLKNFDWEVQLEGSHDQQKWFTILDKYRIMAIQNNSTNFSFTTLNFPNSNYKYYRLFIPKTDEPNFEHASILMRETQKGTIKSYDVKKFSLEANQKLKQTEINIELKEAVPIFFLKLNTNVDFDYYRAVQVEYLTDSIKTDKGWNYIYNTLANDIIKSGNENQFEINNTITKKLKVTIYNNDNTPLKFSSVEVKGFEYELITRIDEEASYYLVYGNDTASQPDYDIAHFHDKIPKDATALTLGEEQKIKNTTSTANEVQPLFQNKWWMWAIMIIIITVLGYFTLKMMKKVNEQNKES